MEDEMNEPVEDDTEEIHPAPFRFLTYGDGTADSPGVRIKSTFNLIPNDFESDLDHLIMISGGDVLDDYSSESDAEYAVTLLDERYYLKYSTKNCALPYDTFSSLFVADAIENARKKLPLPDLNKYRLTPSKYNSYDANQILLQHIKWSDLVPLNKPPSCKATARNVISEYVAASSTLKTHYQSMKKMKKNEKNLQVETAPISEIVHSKQKSAEREERKQCRSVGTAEKIVEEDELSSNRNNTRKSPTSAQRKQKPAIEESTADSASRQELASKALLPEKNQSKPTDKPDPHPGRVHRSQSLTSPEAGNKDDLLTADKDGADELQDPMPPPRSDRTDQVVLAQLNRTVTPRKNINDNDITLPITEEEVAGDGESSDSHESNDSRTNQTTPVKLVPNPVLGVTPPRVKRPTLEQRVFGGPAFAKSGSKPKSPSHSKTDKPAENAKRGNHDGWLSEEDEASLSENENNDSSDYSLSDGESNMFKRPKLVPRAFAGPSSAKKKNKKKTVQKSQLPRSANSIAKAQIGFDNDDGWVSTDASINDLDEDNMSTSSGSTGSMKKRPKLTFSRDEGQRILNLICEKKAYMYTKGNRLWQQVEESGLFPGRTHQSLKEHWRKKVLPNALQNSLYQIKPENLSQLKKAQERMKWSQHANSCPDFTF